LLEGDLLERKGAEVLAGTARLSAVVVLHSWGPENSAANLRTKIMHDFVQDLFFGEIVLDTPCD
jgi:hypothetical protein